MNIKETIEKIKRQITIGECEKNIGIPVYISDLKTVLSELEKKDKVINEMAGQIFYWQDDKFPLGYSKKDVIDFYTNKVEREGK